MKKSILSVLVIVSLLFSFTGCLPDKFSFAYDTNDISGVEVVEFTYDHRSETPHTRTIVKIADTEDFIERLSKVPYYSTPHPPFGMTNKCLAFKVEYENGNYEVFDQGAKGVYRQESDSFYAYEMISTFKGESFYKFLHFYLPDNDAIYTYLYPVEEISSVDMVKVGDDYSLEVIKSIENIDRFVEQHQALRYTYNPIEYDSYECRAGVGDSVFRITYQNGDYELFNAVSRMEIYGGSSRVVYIGRFDEDEFNIFWRSFG